MGEVRLGVVMLVDDNEIDSFINKKVIEFSELTDRIVGMTSGMDAIDYLEEATQDDIPELIFLDLNMPIVDGFKFLLEYSKMKEEIRMKSSIVVLTSSDNLRDKEKIAANHDVIYFLSKPLNDEKLAAVVEKFQEVRQV